MSKYTTEVRFICEHDAGLTESKGYSHIEEILTACLPNVFDFEFPIFDETYRPILEKKILRHYYTREIGEETVGLWKLRLATRLNEIMPYYNKLYETELIEFNPLYDVNLTTERTIEGGGTKNDTTTGTKTTTKTNSLTIGREGEGTETHDMDRTTNGTNVRYDEYSDTPQGGLTGVDNKTYLTNARKISDNIHETEGTDGTITTEYTSEDTHTGSESGSETTGGTLRSTLTNTEEYVEHVTGKSAGMSFARAIMEFRDSLLNIDMMIIDNLSDLFMGLW